MGYSDGLHRWQGPGGRKHPVTIKMMKWLREYLFDGAGLSRADAVVAWTGISLAFFFMLRAVQDGRSWSEERVLHGDDVEAWTSGERTRAFKGCEEVIVHIKGSKTDQYNVGCTRNQYRSGTDLDPCAAMEMYEKEFPQRLAGSEAGRPIMRWADGSYVRRAEIQHFLEIAAVAFGEATGTMGSHSLRIGGATAMNHVVNDLVRVKRFGRWQSDTFHGYLWESHEPMKPISEQMARDESTLTRAK